MRHRAPPPPPREVIIDGHNVLLTEGRGAGEEARQQLIRDAARHRDRRDLAVTVVFDGRGASGVSESTPYPGVRVLYADDADRAIVARVERARAPATVLVITADRALRAAVEAIGGRAEPSTSLREPRRRRRPRRAAATSSDKPSHVSQNEVDYWLGVFGGGGGDDDSDDDTSS